MHIDRLKRAVELLREDAANEIGVKFDLGNWIAATAPFGSATTYGATKMFEAGETIPVSCDTFACAMGLFALSGEFKPEGLSYGIPHGSPGLQPIMQNRVGFGAAEELFGIKPRTAEILFSPDYYDNTEGAEAELEVADRIEQLIAENDQDEFIHAIECRDAEGEFDDEDADVYEEEDNNDD